jgi:hypothetical protein
VSLMTSLLAHRAHAHPYTPHTWATGSRDEFRGRASFGHSLPGGGQQSAGIWYGACAPSCSARSGSYRGTCAKGAFGNEVLWSRREGHPASNLEQIGRCRFEPDPAAPISCFSAASRVCRSPAAEIVAQHRGVQKCEVRCARTPVLHRNRRAASKKKGTRDADCGPCCRLLAHCL